MDLYQNGVKAGWFELTVYFCPERFRVKGGMYVCTRYGWDARGIGNTSVVLLVQTCTRALPTQAYALSTGWKSHRICHLCTAKERGSCMHAMSLDDIARTGMTLCRGHGRIPLNDPDHHPSKLLVRLSSGFLPERIRRGQSLTLLTRGISMGLAVISAHLESCFVLERVCLGVALWLTSCL